MICFERVELIVNACKSYQLEIPNYKYIKDKCWINMAILYYKLKQYNKALDVIKSHQPKKNWATSTSLNELFGKFQACVLVIKSNNSEYR